MNNDFCNAYLGFMLVQQMSVHDQHGQCSTQKNNSLFKKWIKQLLALR